MLIVLKCGSERRQIEEASLVQRMLHAKTNLDKGRCVVHNPKAEGLLLLLLVF